MPTLIDQTIDIFCEKLERVDVIGPNRRLIFTVTSVEAPDCSIGIVKSSQLHSYRLIGRKPSWSRMSFTPSTDVSSGS